MSFSTYDILTEFVDAARHVDAAQLEFQWWATRDEHNRETYREQNRNRRPYLRALKSRRWAEVKASDPARYQATLATYRARNSKCRAARKARAAA